jgi:NAD(P)-dependent dehydrogenase (short-subunit alcohol dehydrogenase family)
VGRLDGKVALITGAASGMGRVGATLFASEGARIVLADVLDADTEAATQEIRSSGGQAHSVHADVANAADAEAMVATAMDQFGALDVL